MGGPSRPDGHNQALRKGPSPSGHLGQPLRNLSQLSPKGLSPAHVLGSLALELVPLAGDLARLQLPLLHLLGLGSHLLPSRRSLRPCRRRLCPRRRCLRFQLLIEQPKVHRLGALLGEALIGLGKRSPLGPQRIPDVALATVLTSTSS